MLLARQVDVPVVLPLSVQDVVGLQESMVRCLGVRALDVLGADRGCPRYLRWSENPRRLQ